MKTIKIFQHTGSFASNKDVARDLRERIILPELLKGHTLVLDFKEVDGATQSFIHALISDALRQVGPAVALNLISFKACNESVQGIITIVTDYMQAGIE